MSSISVGMAITGGPTAMSLQPHQRVVLKFAGGQETVTIATVRPLGGGNYSVLFITSDATTFRMEYNPQTGAGSVKE